LTWRKAARPYPLTTLALPIRGLANGVHLSSLNAFNGAAFE